MFLLVLFFYSILWCLIGNAIDFPRHSVCAVCILCEKWHTENSGLWTNIQIENADCGLTCILNGMFVFVERASAIFRKFIHLLNMLFIKWHAVPVNMSKECKREWREREKKTAMAFAFTIYWSIEKRRILSQFTGGLMLLWLRFVLKLAFCCRCRCQCQWLR